MSEKAKLRPFRERVTLVAAGFAVGLAIGLWIGHWENQFKQEAAKVMGEARFIEIMSEDLDRVNQYWDSKPEVARALLERQLRAHERLLQSVKTYSGNYALFTEDHVNKDMAFIHVKLAVLCQRLNEPDCVSEHATKAMALMNMSSNQVYAAMASFEETNRVNEQTPK